MSIDALPDASTAFHNGELAAQSRVGVSDQDARLRARVIRPFMPDQHRAFFQTLPFMVIGSVDATGQPWASAAFGAQGFVSSPDPQTLIVGAPPLLMDELGLHLTAGAKLGLLGIELQTRRRNRVNGTVAALNARGLILQVDQSFGNCPKYIQVRDLAWRDDGAEFGRTGPVVQTTTTEKVANALIRRSDMFFIASRTAALTEDRRTGVDVSHRGGKPGFVRVAGDGRLSIPDFSGNLFFNTIGNIQSDARIGLFFPDFATGDAVFVAGRAEIEWEGEAVAAFKGAERLIHVLPDQVVLAKQALPIKGVLKEAWPPLAETGDW